MSLQTAILLVRWMWKVVAIVATLKVPADDLRDLSKETDKLAKAIAKEVK